MNPIIIGKSAEGNVTLDLDVLLRTRLLITSNSGGGKSFLIRRLAEQMFGKIQIIIIDPEGEFATLRERYGYVLVGKGGETPADPRSAPMLAEKLLELRASAICDLYEMKDRDRHTWVKLFCDALINAPKKLWHPVIIVVDEVHTFCPEKGKGESEAADSVIALATRGRKRGFAPIFATQRLGKLSKDAAAELLNVLVGGTFIDIDRKRSADSLGVDKPDLKSFYKEIKLLKPGQFYGLGRAIALERTLIKVGSINTTHPELGSSKHAAEPPPPPSKVRALLPKLADLPKEAEEKARTVAEMKREIHILRTQLHAAPKEKKTVVKEIAKIPARYQKAIEEIMKFIVKVESADVIIDTKRIVAAVSKSISVAVDGINREIEAKFKAARRDGLHIKNLLENLKTGEINVKVSLADASQSVPFHPIPPQRKRHEGDNGVVQLPPGELACLKAAAQYDDGRTRQQITVISGYKRSTRDAYIARLKQKGYIDIQGNIIIATSEGVEALGSNYEPPMIGKDLQEFWLSRLPSGEKKILENLIEAYPGSVQRDDLDAATGFARSSRDAYISRLSAKSLVEIAGQRQVKASEDLFS